MDIREFALILVLLGFLLELIVFFLESKRGGREGRGKALQETSQ